MESSDSEDERFAVKHGYQPILAEQIKNSPRAARTQSEAVAWPSDGVNMYQNDLFKDGDVLGAPSGQDRIGSAMGASQQQNRPGTAQRMMQAKSGLAARRAERMQAGAVEKNDSLSRNLGSPSSQGSQLDNRSRLAQASAEPQAPSPLRPAWSAGRQEGGDNNIYGLSPSYDPNEENGVTVFSAQPRTRPPTQQQQPNRELQFNDQPPVPAPLRLDLSDIGAFLMQPGPKAGPVQCYIVRDKGSAKMYPKYNLFLEDGKRFLLAARKRKKQTTSNYVISLDYEDLGRDSENFFGKLRANFVGTDFTIFDSGDKDRGQRAELGCITYGYNVLGTRGPRKMTAVIPCVNGSGESLYRPTSENDTMIERVKSERGLDDLMVMFNKPPRWNEELNAYCLNFNGRVTEASVKNFQLVTDDNQGYVILQFGKIGRNTFTMDYQWPMSALQAFSICLSSFDNKFACE